ncbi:alpha/beta hydrolase family protein [Actinoplanes sp. CA-054009]
MAPKGTGVAALALSLLTAGCVGGTEPAPVKPAVERGAVPAARELSYPVGLRILHLKRGERPLTTLLFYPAARPSGGDPGGPAAGRFPVVLFSHGLRSSPVRWRAALTAWASAGFVVAAPAYPRTSEFAREFRRDDIGRQPDDARFVLREVVRLDRDRRDALSGHLDTGRLAAVGHSAGGYTTSGLFVAGHDPRLRAGVIMAGWSAPGAFAGPPATLLFLQGRADPVVPPAASRAAYDRVPWPKSYILMRNDSHGTYLRPGDRGYPAMLRTTTDFLRSALYGDEAIRLRRPESIDR